MDDSEQVFPEDVRCLSEVIGWFEARRDEYVNLLEGHPAAEPLAAETAGAKAVWLDLHYPFYEPHHRPDKDGEVHRQMNAWRKKVFALVRKCADPDDPVYQIVSQLTPFSPDHLHLHKEDDVKEAFDTRIQRLHALRVTLMEFPNDLADRGGEPNSSLSSQSNRPPRPALMTKAAQAATSEMAARRTANNTSTKRYSAARSKKAVSTPPEIIKAIKVKKGWKMNKLAHEIEVSRSTLFAYQAGKRIGIESTAKIIARLRELAPEGISTESLGVD